MYGNRKLIEHIFTNGNMNEAKYLDKLHQETRGNIFNRYWWVQDGAPAHRTLIVKERWLKIFQNRMIVLGHDSPDYGDI